MKKLIIILLLFCSCARPRAPTMREKQKAWQEMKKKQGIVGIEKGVTEK